MQEWDYFELVYLDYLMKQQNVETRGRMKLTGWDTNMLKVCEIDKNKPISMSNHTN